MIKGFLEQVRDRHAFGWALGDDHNVPVRIQVLHNGELVGSGETTVHRPDLGAKAGFVIEIRDTVPPLDILKGTFAVVAEGIELQSNVSTILRGTVEPLLPGLNDTDLFKLVSDELERRKNNTPIARPDHLSTFHLPVGHLSMDGSAIVGREGHLFLATGSNQLLQQYKDARPDAVVEGEAEKWRALIATRAERLGNMGIDYRQIIIPEKSTALAALWPTEVTTPTRLFAAVERLLKADAFYVSILDTLAMIWDRSSLYKKTDTHLSAPGALLVTNTLLSSLGFPLMKAGLTRKEPAMGDLADKFPSTPLYGQESIPDADDLRALSMPIDIVESVSNGTHLGTRVVTRNTMAPIKKKVVVIGNSFFNKGEQSNNLSWWMIRYFEEFHFLWSPAFDFDYIAKVNPDIVIGQSIERFLPILPGR